MEEQPTHAVVEVPAGSAPEAHGAPGVMDVSGALMGLTWVTFILMTVILYKVAWKPILDGLQRREDVIRKSLEDAQRIRDEMAAIEDVRSRIVSEADDKARDIVETARKAAVETAGVIEAKAREEAQILVENAEREIRAAHDKAVTSLRRESADLAIDLARRIIGENLDEARSRQLTEQIIRKI
jgi:F-type H+-transporting ATPase subunit b